MPRLATILVIGSQAISTRPLPAALPLSVVVATALPPFPSIAGKQLRPWFAPLGLLVQGVLGDLAEAADDVAVQSAGRGRHPRAGRLVHERHELVAEARHGAADADAAHVGTAADAVDPAALGD